LTGIGRLAPLSIIKSVNSIFPAYPAKPHPTTQPDPYMLQHGVSRLKTNMGREDNIFDPLSK
jgi:hypothetical protein